MNALLLLLHIVELGSRKLMHSTAMEWKIQLLSFCRKLAKYREIYFTRPNSPTNLHSFSENCESRKKNITN